MPNPGEVVVVRYRDSAKKVVYHERIVLIESPDQPGVFGTVSPDGQQFDEDFSGDKKDVVEIHDSLGLGFRPAAIKRAALHTFQETPTPLQLFTWLDTAAQHFDAAIDEVPFVVAIHNGSEIVADPNGEEDMFQDLYQPPGHRWGT